MIHENGAEVNDNCPLSQNNIIILMSTCLTLFRKDKVVQTKGHAGFSIIEQGVSLKNIIDK